MRGSGLPSRVDDDACVEPAPVGEEHTALADVHRLGLSHEQRIVRSCQAPFDHASQPVAAHGSVVVLERALEVREANVVAGPAL